MGRIPNGFIIFSPKGNIFLNSMTIFSIQFKILGNGISQSFTLSLKSGHPPFMLATHLNLTVKLKKFGLTLSINYFFSYFNAWMHWDCHELLPSLSWVLYLMSICFFESFFSLIWVFFYIILSVWHVASERRSQFMIKLSVFKNKMFILWCRYQFCLSLRAVNTVYKHK